MILGWNLPVFVCKIWVVKLNKFRTTAVECKSWKACRRWCDIGVLGHICVLEFFFYIKRLIKWGVLVVSLVLFTRQHVLIQGEVALFSSESAIVEVPGQTEEHWSHFSPLWVLQLSSPKCPRLQMDHWVKRGCLCEHNSDTYVNLWFMNVCLIVHLCWGICLCIPLFVYPQHMITCNLLACLEDV